MINAMMQDDVLAIYVWNRNTATGTQKRYRVRGSGMIYRSFGQSLTTFNVIDPADDFPWDYFSFGSEGDDQRFMLEWGSYITVDDDDETPYVAPAPVDPDRFDIESFVFDTLMSEIQRELDAEFIRGLTAKR